MSDIANNRLRSLREREKAIKASIARQVELERKRAARQQEQVVRIVGTALLREAERSAPLKGVVRETLDCTVVDEKSRRLLRNLGWI